MGQGLGHGNLGKLFGGKSAKRPPAGGKNHPFDLFPPARLQGLKHRTVFAIDGQDSGVFFVGKLRHERPPNHQALLVCQGDRLAGLQGRPRTLQSGTADNGRNDDIDFRINDHFGHGFGTDQQFDFRRQFRPILLGGSLRIGDNNVSRSYALACSSKKCVF